MLFLLVRVTSVKMSTLLIFRTFNTLNFIATKLNWFTIFTSITCDNDLVELCLCITKVNNQSFCS